MSGLKPCPFCGSKNLRMITAVGESWVLCECKAYAGTAPNESIARDIWNTRAAPELPDGYRETRDGRELQFRYEGGWCGIAWETTDYEGDGFEFPANTGEQHAMALGIWLQRRASE